MQSLALIQFTWHIILAWSPHTERQVLTMESNITEANETDPISKYTYYLYIVHIIIAIGIIFSNALVIISVYKFQSLRTVSNWFVVNLAVADLLTVLCWIPAKWTVSYVKANFSFCYVIICMSIFPQKSSSVFLALIALDRLLYIQAPFAYERQTKPRNVLIITVVGWLTAITMSFWPAAVRPEIVDENCALERVFTATFGIICGSFFASVGLIICITYIMIGVTARRQARKIAAQSCTMDTIAENDVKIRKMMLIVVGTFYICWTPFVVIVVIIYTFGYNPPWLMILREFMETLVYANSFLNPIIYARRSRPFRTAFKGLLNMKSSSSTSSSSA